MLGWVGARVGARVGGWVLGWVGARVGGCSGGWMLGWAGARVGARAGGRACVCEQFLRAII